jgi:hypothetical protein
MTGPRIAVTSPSARRVSPAKAIDFIRNASRRMNARGPAHSSAARASTAPYA